MNRWLLQRLGVTQEVVALDSAGFRPTQASPAGPRGQTFRGWVNGGMRWGQSAR